VSDNFRKSNRLLSKHDYANVFSNKPKKMHHKNFLILAVSNNLETARIGLAVSKKHCKKAVDRNKIKRIVREIFRKNKKSLKSMDLVFLSKPGLHLYSKSELYSIIQPLIIKVGI